MTAPSMNLGVRIEGPRDIGCNSYTGSITVFFESIVPSSSDQVILIEKGGQYVGVYPPALHPSRVTLLKRNASEASREFLSADFSVNPRLQEDEKERAKNEAMRAIDLALHSKQLIVTEEESFRNMVLKYIERFACELFVGRNRKIWKVQEKVPGKDGEHPYVIYTARGDLRKEQIEASMRQIGERALSCRTYLNKDF